MRWPLVLAGFVIFGAGFGAGYVAAPLRNDISATASTAALGDYQGSARGLVLTPIEAKYSKLVSSQAFRTPSSGKRTGFLSGWDVTFRDETPHSVAQAALTIFVYDTHSHARAAYDDACSICTRRQLSGGVAVKYVTSREEGLPTVGEITTCRNVYVAVVAASSGESTTALARDGGYLVGATYRKAMLLGMGRCSEQQP